MNCIHVFCKFNAKKITTMENRERATKKWEQNWTTANLKLGALSNLISNSLFCSHLSFFRSSDRCQFPVSITSKPNERIATGKLLHCDDVCQNEKLI